MNDREVNDIKISLALHFRKSLFLGHLTLSLSLKYETNGPWFKISLL